MNGQYFSDKNFRILIYSEKREYSESGEYTRIQIYEQEQDGWKVVVTKVNSDNKVLSKLFYKDDTLKDIVIQATIEYFEDGTSLEKQVDYSRNYSCIVKKDNKNRPIEEVDGDAKYTFYKNKDFKDLLCISKEFNNEDGNIEKQINFEVEHRKWNSTRFIKDKNTNNVIYQEWFNEKDFKDFGCSSTLEYNQNGSYIEKVFYGDILKKDCYNEIVYYSETGQKLKREYYTDKDYKDLFASEKYEYGKNSMYSKVIYEKPYKQNILSAIEYSDKNNKRYYAVAYTDNDFKNIYRKTWVKYPKDGKMFLRIYAKKQNGYYSEIEKFDKNKNLIYKHQYKFKGILPKIFFCLSW